jgi:hypothetical protein
MFIGLLNSADLRPPNRDSRAILGVREAVRAKHSLETGLFNRNSGCCHRILQYCMDDDPAMIQLLFLAVATGVSIFRRRLFQPRILADINQVTSAPPGPRPFLNPKLRTWFPSTVVLVLSISSRCLVYIHTQNQQCTLFMPIIQPNSS